MKKRTPILLSGCLLMAVVTSCDGNERPTASQAGDALKKHITSLLSGINARDVVIIKNEASEESCSKHKEKYIYSVKATERIAGSDTPDLLVSIMTGQASRIADYHLTKAMAGKTPVSYLHDKKTYTNLMLSSPGKSQIEISGSTDCLQTGH